MHARYLLPAATKLGQGNIFTSVCQEFCPQGGGCLPQCMLGCTPSGGRPPPEQTPQDQTPQDQAPWSRHLPTLLGPDTPPEPDPPGADTPPPKTRPPGADTCPPAGTRHPLEPDPPGPDPPGTRPPRADTPPPGPDPPEKQTAAYGQ